MEDESTSQIITAPSTSFQMDGILLDSKTIMVLGLSGEHTWVLVDFSFLVLVSSSGALCKLNIYRDSFHYLDSIVLTSNITTTKLTKFQL